MRRRGFALVPAIVALGLLAACGSPDPEPTEGYLEVPGAEQPLADDAAPDAGSGAGPLEADGLPVSGLQGCEELVDATVSETEFDTQWRWEFACTSRAAFDATVAALDADGELTHTVNQVVGNDSYISDLHHWIGEKSAGVVDVDAKLTGAPDDLEMTFLVTLAKE